LIEKLNRCKAPFYVQFELTTRCNNKCFFCYNHIGNTYGDELSTAEIKRILFEMSEAGVFRINFNGGEPLLRKDFFEICQYAHDLGFELHMNTNATLIDEAVAKKISKYMKSVCVSILSDLPHEHDSMSGRKGALDEVLVGMDNLKSVNVGIEVNVCTMMTNYKKLFSIAEKAAQHGCYTICSTRYILSDPSQSNLLMTPEATIELLDILSSIESKVNGIEEVSLPGPVPFCELPEEEYSKLAKLNVPCQYGYGLCRISSNGLVTACTISPEVISDLKTTSFQDAWQAKGWEKFSKLDHVPLACRSCDEFSRCKAGCIVYDECLKDYGIPLQTKKWSESF